MSGTWGTGRTADVGIRHGLRRDGADGGVLSKEPAMPIV